VEIYSFLKFFLIIIIAACLFIKLSLNDLIFIYFEVSILAVVMATDIVVKIDLD